MTTVLIQDLYQGTVISDSLPWQATKTMVTASCVMSDQAAQDTDSHVGLVLEASFDNGQSFAFASRVVWQGGQPPGPGGGIPLPSLTTGYSVGGNTPSHVRIRLELPDTLSVGATLNFS